MIKKKIDLKYNTKYAQYGIGITSSVSGAIVVILKTTNTSFNWRLWLVLLVGIVAVGSIGIEMYYNHKNECELNKELNHHKNNKDCIILALEPFFPKLFIAIALLGIVGVILGLCSK